MFTAYISTLNLQYYIFDSRQAGVASYGLPYVVGDGSTVSEIVTNTATSINGAAANPNKPPSQTSWVGAHFIIMEDKNSPANKVLTYAGSLIASATVDIGYVTDFTLATPLSQAPLPGTTYAIVKREDPPLESVFGVDCFDLRRFIKDITWSTSIDVGFDTATISLNDSASIMGKFFTMTLGQSIEIYDVWGNFCWGGIVAGVYVDESGGRIECIGYKRTFDWFRFERAYLPISTTFGFVEGDPGPTTTQVLQDVAKANPYIKRNALWKLDGQIRESISFNNEALPSTNFPYEPNIQAGNGDIFSSQQLVTTNYIGLGELDFSDASYKCSDVINFVEQFGYYQNHPKSLVPGVSRDSIKVQCWRNGVMEIQRIFSGNAILLPDYRISRKSVKNSYADVEISGDILDVNTETYVIYTDADGVQQISNSYYDYGLIRRLGVRSLAASSSVPPELANIMAQNSRWDKSLLVGIGTMQIVGHVKRAGMAPVAGVNGGSYNYKTVGGQGSNIPSYLMKAGRVVEFEENIGLASLYKNSKGVPGIFYIGSTSFNASSGITTITPATTLSVMEMFTTRQSGIRN